MADLGASVASSLIDTYQNMKWQGPTVRNQYELTPSARKYTAFASAAYDDLDHVKGYALDRNLSTGQFKVYVKGDRLVFAVRGSKTPKDFLVSDLSVTRGQEAIQMRETRAMFDKIMAKYPKKRKIAVGHSLSGLSVSRLKFEEGDKIESSYAFNPASSPFGGEQYKQYMRQSYDQPNAHVIVKQGDLVSANMLPLARDLQVIQSSGKVGDTVSQHFMSNFEQNEHISNISNLLKKHGQETSDVIHKLHTQNKTDASLERRHNKLKTQLEGGSGAVGINEGSYLTSGGFHNTYDPKPDNMVSWQGHKIPGPGARIFLNPTTGIQYTFDRNGGFVYLEGTLAQKAKTLREKAAHFGEGPAIIYDARDSPPTRGVAAVPATGGMGLDFVQATEKGDYIAAFTGIDKHQLDNDGIKFFEGTKSKFGHVGNGMANPYEKIERNVNDGWSDVALSAGEFLGKHAWGIYSKAVRATVDTVTLGASEVAMQMVSLGTGVTGFDDFMQKRINTFMPDKRHDSMNDLNRIFASAKNYKTAQTQMWGQNPDPALTADPRIPWRIDRLQKSWKDIRERASKLGIDTAEDDRLLELHPHWAMDAGTQEEQVKWLNNLSGKYEFMKKSFKAADYMKTLDGKADKLGLGAVTKQKNAQLREIMIPPLRGAIPYKASELETRMQESTTLLTNKVHEKIRTAPEILKKYEAMNLGVGREDTEILMHDMLSKNDFIKEHIDMKSDQDVKSIEQGYHQYQKEFLRAIDTAHGKYKKASVDQMTPTERRFYEKYQKTQEGVKAPKEMFKYFDPNYFATHKDRLSKIETREKEILVDLHRDYVDSIPQFKKTSNPLKLKTQNEMREQLHREYQNSIHDYSIPVDSHSADV